MSRLRRFLIMDLSVPASHERFTRLLVAHQRRIYGFIYTLVQDHAATEDVLQETTSVLWKKFEAFDSGTDFGAWALRVARLSVFEWRRKQQKLPLPIDDELLLLLATEAEERLCHDHLARHEALEDCVSRLSERDQNLLSRRYAEDKPVSGIAEDIGRTRDAVYKLLARVHRDLGSCIESKLEALQTP